MTTQEEQESCTSEEFADHLNPFEETIHRQFSEWLQDSPTHEYLDEHLLLKNQAALYLDSLRKDLQQVQETLLSKEEAFAERVSEHASLAHQLHALEAQLPSTRDACCKLCVLM